MDTSLIECDVQPTYVRVTIKGKVSRIKLLIISVMCSLPMLE